MTDVPATIKFGGVVGTYVEYQADSIDAGNVPDQVGLNGTGVLTPSVKSFKVPSATPPVWVNVAPVNFKVTNGVLTATSGQALYVLASLQPASDLAGVKIMWTVEYNLVGVAVQPPSVSFEVVDGAVLDISQLAGA